MLARPHKKPLPDGTLLNEGKYLILGKLGEGGLSIIYKAISKTGKLDKPVAIKELYTEDCEREYQVGGTRRWIPVQPTETQRKHVVYHGPSGKWANMKRRFLSEASILNELTDIHGIVNIYDEFEENNTAYLVLQLINGRDLE